jgi:NAD(P)-dependent dehydrogenase (short-subunit alcohol dehydrogenase family)
VTVDRPGRVEGRVAIVTGAGATPGPGMGTGRAAAILLAREGARVAVVALHADRADETVRMIRDEGGEAITVTANVATDDGAAAMTAATVDAWGTVDILVNNIGVGSFGDVTQCTEAEWDRTFDTNLRTAFLASKHAIPVMAERGRGSIVNVASIAAHRAVGHPAYSASKGAMTALTVDMAYSHGRQGIRVNSIAPGHIDTPLLRSTQQPGPATDLANALRTETTLLGTDGDGWDVGHAVVFLASDEARWITGVALPVDGGIMAVAPLLLAGRFRSVPGPADA